MIPEPLEPRLELVREEYVLVQAWKKTASYIRYHNWFSDTLALDRVSVNLPTFIGELRERLQSSESWQNDPLRIVPAPKSQRWRVREDAWEPVEGATWEQIRPLAHVSLADQVLTTALMLCLADRIETMQSDPRLPVSHSEYRKQVISYGNRLFCDDIGGELRHRWGSAKLYRAYYQDYQRFLSRPEVAAESISADGGRGLYVIHADLQQFYDRVRPDLLAQAMDSVRRDDDDPLFFSLAASVLDWRWDSRDESDVGIYAEQANLEDFTRVALPQGLVGSGFFANIVLLPVDDAMRASIGTEIAPGIWLADSCRYVDDFRILVSVAENLGRSLNELKKIVATWLEQLLHENATGLALSPRKIQIAALRGTERRVRLGAKMKRIQSAVSGGFDALGGAEILDAIQGLMRAQEELRVGADSGWRHSPVPDVRDETVARFRAARYRTTFRSIRPLLQDDEATGEFDAVRDDAETGERVGVVRNRHALDDDARTFAVGLIQQWVGDPSNVRLLRIGLDLWPDVELLRDVLALLRPFAGRDGCRKAPWRVAWYCLAEVMRAGATETGLVADTDSLPLGIDLESYREELRLEADRLAALPGQTIPWYLRQQALLFLAASDPNGAPVASTEPETLHYCELIQFLRGEAARLRSSDFATFAVLARRAFVDRVRAIELTQPGLSSSRKRQLAQTDPSFLMELSDAEPDAGFFDDLPLRVREDLCRTSGSSEGDHDTLAEAVLNAHPTGSLRNELSLLRFAMAFLEQWERRESPPEVVTPGQVTLKLGEDQAIADVEDLQILPGRTDASGSLYEVATWCEAGERWRFHLGFLLRFILSGQPDFTRSVRRTGWRETQACYRPAENHWYQRMYGLFNGQAAFGDDWLPITEWVEEFLVALLRWPGCSAPKGFSWVEQGCESARTRIGERIAYLEQRRGSATRALILPLLAKRPTRTTTDRPLRACVVQTAVPASKDFQPADLRLDGSAIRRKHRNHLSAALAAVERMLALRATHKGEGELDWLILPELAVHPQDVRTHLIPFARVHRAMILTGLTYEEILSGQPLVNSALWVIPEWSAAYGLQIRTRRQGKQHLAPDEHTLNGGAHVLQGFRPCQWLIGYPWSSATGAEPVWLTAAVCYDATDLGLAADLTEMSDVLAIPALNKDVKTFDQMALALHYHMFQLVVVANNGQYGGSNAYWPRSGDHIRQVFHIHGQPQASIAFLEIDDVAAFLERHDVSGAPAHGLPKCRSAQARSRCHRAGKADEWKHPPAGLNRAAPRGSP